MKKAIIFVLVWMAVSSSSASADLATSRLDALIAESDIILHAGAMKLEAGDVTHSTESSATLRVWHVFKGSHTPETIVLRFGLEEHEQHIALLHQDYLLFLKKTSDGQYTGTHYGRSYWPLEWTVGDKAKLVTPYVYPMNIIAVPDNLLKDAEVMVPDRGLEKQHIKAIYLEDVQNLINTT